MPELVHWFAENPVRWVVPAVLLLAVVGVPLALWWEKRHPSSYTHRVGHRGHDNAALDAAERREQGFVRSQAAWRRLGAEGEAFLDPAAQAGLDAEDAAREAAEHLAQRVQINALHHP
ncbi:hypothetical protein [Streptomyces sp. NBC_00847]|uniref:hypothetical protein n=1 Tax=Streptomyces sp. NBC_00847 TaxID=2975850 RepID=UPI00225E444C|nr:hypothetical protein [Streptomyces sp. NBC_00847]MCX4885958.1 hypothetical protein [Streptomyces sp. NBC_00847]